MSKIRHHRLAVKCISLLIILTSSRAIRWVWVVLASCPPLGRCLARGSRMPLNTPHMENSLLVSRGAGWNCFMWRRWEAWPCIQFKPCSFLAELSRRQSHVAYIVIHYNMVVLLYWLIVLIKSNNRGCVWMYECVYVSACYRARVCVYVGLCVCLVLCVCLWV